MYAFMHTQDEVTGACHGQGIVEKVYKSLFGKLRWENNIKVDVKEEGRQNAFISHSRVNRECSNEPSDSKKRH